MCAMSPRLLRPIASGIHPEAAVWGAAVVANGGSIGVSLRAVSDFCRRIDAAGLRDRFARLSLVCGSGLNAALVPLYRGFSRTGTQYGNTTDTNNGPFVSGDYNETGASSGLKANGTSKYLNTGVPADTFTASDSHLGVGLRATESRAAAFRTAIGAFNGSVRSFEISLHGTSSRNGSAFFTRFGTNTDCAGDNIGGATGSLAAGDIIAAYPSMYRNGSATGQTATTSQDYGSAHSIYVFANNNANSSVINYTDARISWYSVGLTMTADQALSFYNAIAAFNTALSRT
jgi:hypothetical protein